MQSNTYLIVSHRIEIWHERKEKKKMQEILTDDLTDQNEDKEKHVNFNFSFNFVDRLSAD